MTIFAAVGVLAQLCASLTTETLRILVRDTLEALNVVSFATVAIPSFFMNTSCFTIKCPQLYLRSLFLTNSLNIDR